MYITVSHPRMKSDGSVHENRKLDTLEIAHSSFSSLISSLAILHGFDSVSIDEITNECSVIRLNSDYISSIILSIRIEDLFKILYNSLPEHLTSSIKSTDSRKYFTYSVFTISLNY